MKKILFTALLLILASSLIFGGCSEATPAEVTTPTGGTTSEAAAPAQVIELKFSHPYPPTSPYVPGWDAWAKKVEEITDGQVKVIAYPASTLIAEPDTVTGLRDGVIDIGLVTGWVFPEFEFGTLFILPSLGWNPDDAITIRRETEQAFPELAAASSAYKTLWIMATPVETFHINKEAHVPDDMKGLKFIGPPPTQVLIQTIGAEAVGLPPTEHYSALEKGIVDGLIGNYVMVEELRLDEVTKVHLDVPLAQSSMDVLMNLDRWNSLPDDVKQKIDGTLSEVEQVTADVQKSVYEETRNRLLADEGHTVIVPTADEMALWTAKIKPAHQIWIDNMSEKGYPAQEAYDTLMEVIARHKQ